MSNQNPDKGKKPSNSQGKNYGKPSRFYKGEGSSNQSSFPRLPQIMGNQPNVPVYVMPVSYKQMAEMSQSFNQMNFQNHPETNQEIKDFYNPGLNPKTYHLLNNIWKTHCLNQKAEFRRSMSQLAEFLKTQEEKQTFIHSEFAKFIKQVDWLEDFSEEKITTIINLMNFTEQQENSYLHKALRICLFNKAKTALPKEIFSDINHRIENNEIKSLLIEFAENIYLEKETPKLKFFINHELWSMEAIGWGAVGTIIFDSLVSTTFVEFPAMIKTMIYNVVKHYKWSRYLKFKIFSHAGWRQRELFFQPYQIWSLELANEQDFIKNEDLKFLDKAENLDLSSYYIDNYIALKREAQNIHNYRSYKFMISDGRRLFCTNLITSYVETVAQRMAADDFLNNIIHGHVTGPIELTMDAEELVGTQDYYENIVQNQEDNDDSFWNSLEEETLHNIENMMEG